MDTTASGAAADSSASNRRNPNGRVVVTLPGAVVMSDAPAGATVVGNPARVLQR